MLLHIIGAILIVIGVFIIISAIIALMRFPNFLTKLHATSALECCGIPITLFGLSFLQTSYSSIFKIYLMIILILILNPVGSSILARVAYLRQKGTKVR